MMMCVFCRTTSEAVSVEIESGQTGTTTTGNGYTHHERFVSDDAETDALLAAAVAKLDERPVEAQPKPRKGGSTHALLQIMICF